VKGGVEAAKASKEVAQGTKATKNVAKAEQAAQRAERVEYTTKVAKAEERVVQIEGGSGASEKVAEVVEKITEINLEDIKLLQKAHLTQNGINAHILSVGTIHITKARFGHTFVKHGEDATTYSIRRAKSSGVARGQLLDNQRAAQFILDNASKIANGATNVPIPKSFPAHVIMPDGTFKAATHLCIVPSGKGVKTAYPIILLP
jgi:hypothetical protein